MKLSLVQALLAAVPALAVFLPAELNARQVNQDTLYNIHPAGNLNKCIGVKGGKVVEGAAVDVYDCNGSLTQKWSNKDLRGLFVVSPETGERLCMDIRYIVDADIESGEKMQLRPCERTGEDGNPTQIFSLPTAENHYTMPLALFIPTEIPDVYDHFCIDLTDGSMANQNVLQIWLCNRDTTKPWKNQIWKTTVVG